MLFSFVLGCVLLQQVSGLSLTDDELFRLPPLFKLDKYYECLREPGDTYCYTNAKLYGNDSNEIYHTLVEYSAEILIHFNRTLIHRGICLKQCPSYLGRPNRTEELEACVNSSLESYQLQAKVISTICTDYQPETVLDNGDYAFAGFLIFLLLFNCLGSAYDFYQSKYSKGHGNIVTKFLLCFAVRRNWRILLTRQGTSSKMKRVKCLNGFRTISTCLVVLGHCPIPGLITSSNPVYLERTYSQLLFHILYNGTLMVQSFFIISGLLTMYATLVAGNKYSWRSLPSGILNRWFRLTPPYALVMFFVMTLGRHIGDGPLWKPIIMLEVEDCYQAWWRHLLYIQNYFDNNQCMAHAWYLAADFQLSILGLVIACVLNGVRAQKIAIGVVFVIGLFTPAGHVFMQNLHAILIVSPEMALNFFVSNDTFNSLYKRGHTNLSCYALGLALAFLVYNLKDSDIGSHKYRKFRFLYWMLFPIELFLVLTGAVFYISGIQVPLGVRMVYSSAIKVLFGFAICVHILFTILKVDTTHRGVLNWAGWGILAKFTYSAYIVHVCILRTYAADNDALSRMTTYKILMNYISLVGLSFALALPLWFFLETPIANLMKTFIFPPPPKKAEKTKTVSMVADLAASKETVEAKI